MSRFSNLLNELAPRSKERVKLDDPTTDDPPLVIAQKLERTLRSMLLKAVGRHLVEDAWSDVVLERIGSIMNTYDPTKGSIRNHVVVQARWYVYKWHVSSRAARNRKATESLTDREVVTTDNHSGVLVRDALGCLHSFDRWLVEQNMLGGYSIAELATVAGTSVGLLKRRLAAALQQLREYMDDEVTVACDVERL